MIAAQNTKVLDSNITGRSANMTLDVDSLQKIMNRLTDLYSDRILACIREISTNAYDSHVEAGNENPYEVTLPTPLDPYFIVQDYGTGLTADEFLEIYSKYGKSTRDQSDDYAGMMGLGCKAPLTYTSQYMISSVKDGEACEVMITRNEVGTSTVTVVDEGPAPEGASNGVRVKIMVVASDVNAFRERAEKFYRFAVPGTVLVNGREPSYIRGTEVGGDDMLIIKDPNHRNYVIMGGVGYPVAQSGEWTINHGLINGHTLAVRVPMGAVSLPPSREGLSEDKHTKDALAEITKDFHTRIAKSIQREINQCKSPYQALNALLKWNHMLPKSSQPSFANYSFQGRTIPERIDLERLGGAWLVPHEIPTRRGEGGMTAKTRITAIHASEINRRLIFTGWDYSSFSATMRKKLDQWVEDNGLDDGRFSYVLVKQDSFTDHWFDNALVFPWDEVKAIKLETVSRGGLDRYGNPRPSRVPGSFDVITESGSTIGHPADEIDTDEPIFYYEGNLNETESYSIAVTKLFKTGTLVAVPSRRLNKFKRDFPAAKYVRTVINDAARAWVAGVDEDTRRAMHFQSNHSTVVGRIRQLEYEKLLDPAFANYLHYADKDVTAERVTYQALVGVASYEIIGKFFEGIDSSDFKDPFQKYPLAFDAYGTWELRSGSPERSKHFVIYANALYAARVAGMEI